MATVWGFNVFDRNDLWLAGETVNHHQEVFEALGFRERPYDVNVAMFKSSSRQYEGLKWCLDVCVDLGSLTAETSLCQVRDLLVDNHLVVLDTLIGLFGGVQLAVVNTRLNCVAQQVFIIY